MRYDGTSMLAHVGDARGYWVELKASTPTQRNGGSAQAPLVLAPLAQMWEVINGFVSAEVQLSRKDSGRLSAVH
jgi:hypothetical protein